ncbi:hypothetical protein [Flavobacterium sp.]|jgi:hypothetical protein
MQITTISDTHGLHHQLQLTGGDLATEEQQKKLENKTVNIP